MDDKYTVSKIGNGAWYSLHLACANAVSNEDKKAALYIIRLYRTKFVCGICREHFDEYCRRYPPEDHVDLPDGLAKWSWRAHNNANVITGKEEFPWSEFVNRYLNADSQCSECVLDRLPPTRLPVELPPVDSKGYRIVNALP